MRQWQVAKIPGRLFDLSLDYPAAVPGEGWVHGYLVHLPHLGLLAAVDEPEGYAPERSPERNEYQRRAASAYKPTGVPLGRVYTYFMDEEWARGLGGEDLPKGSGALGWTHSVGQRWGLEE